MRKAIRDGWPRRWRGGVIPRLIALWLAVILACPTPGFALRPRAGGFEEETPTVRALQATFAAGMEEPEKLVMPLAEQLVGAVTLQSDPHQLDAAITPVNQAYILVRDYPWRALTLLAPLADLWLNNVGRYGSMRREVRRDDDRLFDSPAKGMLPSRADLLDRVSGTIRTILGDRPNLRERFARLFERKVVQWARRQAALRKAQGLSLRVLLEREGLVVLPAPVSYGALKDMVRVFPDTAEKSIELMTVGRQAYLLVALQAITFSVPIHLLQRYTVRCHFEPRLVGERKLQPSYVDRKVARADATRGVPHVILWETQPPGELIAVSYRDRGSGWRWGRVKRDAAVRRGLASLGLVKAAGPLTSSGPAISEPSGGRVERAGAEEQPAALDAAGARGLNGLEDATGGLIVPQQGMPRWLAGLVVADERFDTTQLARTMVVIKTESGLESVFEMAARLRVGADDAILLNAESLPADPVALRKQVMTWMTRLPGRPLVVAAGVGEARLLTHYDVQALHQRVATDPNAPPLLILLKAKPLAGGLGEGHRHLLVWTQA